MIEGRLFQAGASAFEPAWLSRDAAGQARLRTAQADTVLPAQGLQWSSRVGDTPRRLQLPDGRVFESRDNTGIDAWLRQAGRSGSSRLHRLERMRPQLLALAAAVLLAGFAMLRWGLPWGADFVARHMPMNVEQAIGRGTLDTLDQVVFKPSQTPAAQQAALQSAFRQLATHSTHPDALLVLHFRAGGPLGANAVALPGGAIVMTDELITLAKEDIDGLVGVLAHEIGHVEARHGLRRLARILGLSSAVLLISGDATGLVHDASIAGAGLLDLSYSREFEREADARAVALMRATQRDPDSLGRLLQALTEDQRASVPEWLSSHPDTSQRIDALRNTP